MTRLELIAQRAGALKPRRRAKIDDGLSKQRRYALRLKAAGKCVTCGKPRKEGNTHHCPWHAAENSKASIESRRRRTKEGARP